MSKDDIWNNPWGHHVSSIDAHLQGKALESKAFRSMRDLTDQGRDENALPLPAEAGTRVSFVVNIGSVLTYDKIPESDGTVVMVRTAEGDTTFQGDMVFVKFDDGLFIPVHRHHLRVATTTKKQASAFVLRLTGPGLGDLTDLFASSERTSDLVRKSTKDLWSFEDQGGEFVISRLFDADGEPLKG